MALDEADLVQIAELLSTKLAEAKKDILQGANDGITKRMTAAESKNAETLAKALEAFKVKPVETVTKEGEGDPNHPLAIKLRSLESMAKESATKLEEAEKKAKAATEKNRRETLRARTSEGLQAVGIKDPNLNKVATGFLIDSERRVGWEDESDENNENRVFRDASGQNVEFDAGIRAWAKTDMAKNFMAPSGLRGSGSSGGGNTTKTLNKEEQVAKHIFDMLPKG